MPLDSPYDNSVESLISFTPKATRYAQVKREIIDHIQKEIWPYGYKLPSEIQLAQIFKVSQGTMRRALRDLVQEGFLIRHQGRGTFVNSYSANFDLFYKKFVPIRADDPNKTWKTVTRMTLFEVIPINLQIASLMQTNDLTEKIIHIRRLHYAKLDDQNIRRVDVFGELFLRQRFFPTLTETVFRGQKNSLYAFYQNTLGVTIMHSRDIIKAVILTQEQARLAHVSYPYPGLALQRQSYDINNNIVELRYQVCLTDRCHLECLN